MTGKQLARLFRRHGGVKEIHVMPAEDREGRKGWANRYVCVDGFARTLTPREERMLARVDVRPDHERGR